jgi:serine protease Do
VTPEIAQGLGLPRDGGALVADVTPASPAAKAGFKQGDVILSFNGHDIGKVRDLPIVVAQTPVGDKAQIEVFRNGKRDSLEVAIAAMPENLQAVNARGGDQPAPEAEDASALGLQLAPLSEQMRKRAGVPKGVKGVVVTAIDAGSPLAELGIQPGDVIQQINQQPVTTPQQAESKLKQAQSGKGQNLLLLINRRGTNQYLALSMGKGDNG